MFIILYSSFILSYLLSLKFLSLILINIGAIFILEYFIHHFGSTRWSRILHYIIFACSIAIAHRLEFVADNREQDFLIHVSFSWLNAKLLSCSIDLYDGKHYDDQKKSWRFTFIRLAYLFYFPPFFFGPIYNFDDFHKSVCHHFNINLIITLIKLFLFWIDWKLEYKFQRKAIHQNCSTFSLHTMGLNFGNYSTFHLFIIVSVLHLYRRYVWFMESLWSWLFFDGFIFSKIFYYLRY